MKTARNSWVWLLALYTVASLIEAGFWSQVTAFTPLYLPRIGVAPQDVTAWTGAIVAISSAIGIPFLPFWGALADRYSRQPVIVRSFVAHLLAGIVCLLAGNVWVFVVGRSLMAFALGNSGLMMTTLSERAPQGRVGFAFSVFNAAGPVGAFLGPLAGGPIVDRAGFGALLGIDVVLMLAVILALVFGYRDAYRPRVEGSLVRMALGSIGLITRSPRLRALFPALFVLFAGWLLAFTYVPLAIAELYHGEDVGTAIGTVIGAGGFVAVLVSPLLGLLADRFGHWRVLYAGGIAAALLWPLPALAGDLLTFGIVFALINGIESAVFALSFSALASSTEPATRGRVMAYAFLPANLGFTVGPAIGSIVTRTSVFAVFPFAGAITFLGVLALAYARRQRLGASVAAESPRSVR